MEDCVLYTSTGLHIPVGGGITLGDFNICDPEERRFNVWNQTFTDGDGKDCRATFLFPHVLEIAQPDFMRRDSTALGIIRTLSRIDRIFITLPMAEARDFQCHSHVCENLGVITQQYASSFKSHHIEDTRANVCPAGCPNIPFSDPFCSGFTTTAISLMVSPHTHLSVLVTLESLPVSVVR